MTRLARWGAFGWGERSQVERVRLYTVGSLHVVFWFTLLMMAIAAMGPVTDPVQQSLMGVCTLALGGAGWWGLREAVQLHPDRQPLPWRPLTTLLVMVAVAEGLVFLVPEKAQFGSSLVVVAVLVWGAGGFRERRLQWFLYVACPALVLLPTGKPVYAAVALAVGLFFLFTVQSSLWLLRVVTELEGSRTTQAALAVAEERLRFSRDIHDVMGRQLSTIAVQAELAATLAERGDGRASQHILQVRETAHEALREARELARGYRPLDLHAELDGAVSLLKAAGISATADLAGLPEVWHEPVARVVREAVTNVLRHSTASRVEIAYADGLVVITNDGAAHAARERVSGGTGLVGLTEQLAPSGVRLTTRHEGDEFVLRVDLAAAPAHAGEDL
jgi:two-component system sensor histidine kinase DesK